MFFSGWHCQVCRKWGPGVCLCDQLKAEETQQVDEKPFHGQLKLWTGPVRSYPLPSPHSYHSLLCASTFPVSCNLYGTHGLPCTILYLG